MYKLKNFIKKNIKTGSKRYIIFSKIYNKLSTIKYNIVNNSKIREKNKYYDTQINIALKKIEEYKNKEYIVLYNPTWLGVANSTKGLFDNNVPLEQVLKRKKVKKIAETIINNNIKSVIFSQIVDGWIDIIRELKNIKSDIIIKVIWHGNCYEFFSDYTWNLNKEVVELYNQGKIESFGFVRTTMAEFYKKVGIKSFYLQNNVKINKNNIENSKKLNKSCNVRVGVYNADSRELKNIYTSIGAISLLNNAEADIVPINKGAKKFTEILNLKITSLDCYISNEELLERIVNNDVNLYPTYTENSPMFPLESLEMGVPCLVGNNNDYFSGTELEKYLVLKREDDPEYIKCKIQECLDNKEKIMKMYTKWKKDFDIRCRELVNNFIEG